MATFSVWHWIIVLAILATLVVPYWQIAKRAGRPPALSLLMLIPVVNLVFIWWLAFTRWPALDR